ncbi:3-hydroxyacyl-CoA dehydrogenase [Actibacterium sp. XHP0104]|uniref:3-hydroxyacyl-CoA dehydrogenase n=1 Tax=Actibacterium sp. XHP0104 TaxID=2984335 RepID=UPI0021E75568|nr:3-hydroxyacyl-CoA dehydrogenase [Actibacterium sp. XHP0104]MCV2882217.1 3-hydroxyacyl-CoA dehydrogenase [Actibacterium sp. XHP0104]
MEIKGRAFVVTGGASGLGSAVTEMLLEQGANVVIADINPPSEVPAGAVFQKTDVTSGDDAQAAIDAAVSNFGALWGLINCAGVAPGEKIIGRKGVHGLESFARAININLVGTFNMLRLAADAMSKNAPNSEGERGVVVNTASVAAFDGQIGQAAYAASKGGVAALTLPAARELASTGIRVVTIAPGIFGTPMMSGMPQEVQDALGASVPFPPRLGRPSEYASTVRHICENVMLNGEVIRLDGALRMAPK